ncbi:MAG: branched-chain amino acid transaminase [Pseudomonadota bacterium]|nr:branched-chain amino acid transaminase [Pseudomonadota bacterium]
MSYADRDGVIWMDGRMVPWREAKVHVLTHTLHYGVGAFEGIRAYKTPQGTALFRLDDHIQRLYNTAHILEMDIPYEFAVIRQACIDAIRENGLETGYVRPLVYYGSEGMGLHADNLSVHVSIAAWVWGAYLGAEALERGIRIKTSSYTRHLVNSIMCRAKACGNYINSIMALQEAARDGYDEALLLDNEGMVAEGSGENIFIVRKGIIYTPDITSALEGITRDTVMSLAAEEGFQVIEKRITRDDVYIANEAFFTGTAAEVTPIRELDNRRIGQGSIGPVTRQLQQAYLDLVEGRRQGPGEWLTIVD